ncbi:unnamed protein product [Caenorhabditis auriculariae]|uniref:Uncharacterized protein n=1 Tax=Caenorhabditis auriculariae TaxID=2777116 RepID=A0A8S1HCS0_9PELO|nr:unnamed protein product [Caenorhabditis auriculariae]
MSQTLHSSTRLSSTAATDSNNIGNFLSPSQTQTRANVKKYPKRKVRATISTGSDTTRAKKSSFRQSFDYSQQFTSRLSLPPDQVNKSDSYQHEKHFQRVVMGSMTLELSRWLDDLQKRVSEGTCNNEDEEAERQPNSNEAEADLDECTTAFELNSKLEMDKSLKRRSSTLNDPLLISSSSSERIEALEVPRGNEQTNEVAEDFSNLKEAVALRERAVAHGLEKTGPDCADELPGAAKEKLDYMFACWSATELVTEFVRMTKGCPKTVSVVDDSQALREAKLRTDIRLANAYGIDWQTFDAGRMQYVNWSLFCEICNEELPPKYRISTCSKCHQPPLQDQRLVNCLRVVVPLRWKIDSTDYRVYISVRLESVKDFELEECFMEINLERARCWSEQKKKEKKDGKEEGNEKRDQKLEKWFEEVRAFVKKSFMDKSVLLTNGYVIRAKSTRNQKQFFVFARNYNLV